MPETWKFLKFITICDAVVLSRRLIAEGWNSWILTLDNLQDTGVFREESAILKGVIGYTTEL